ncbi:MAG TPA: alkane 1-monooxygenase [Lacibacter sp.]|nr:alkane 1-monooxygenase [Lacibacter sp.]HMO88731.1 alkane 1-monooxygenase [Lacibacter sp.]
MSIRPFKYLSPLIVFWAAWRAFHHTGVVSFLPVIYAFGVIPLLELFLKPDTKNLSAAEEELARNDRTYDYILYLIVPLQYYFLYLFLSTIQEPGLDWISKAGRTMSMGLLCGIFGINVAHELGHRAKPYEQWMAKALLLTSLYIHFFVEHNKGHHKRVATPEDPSSARYNESLFSFYPRTILHSYRSAWEIANADQRRKGRPALSLYNEMLQYQLIQVVFLTVIYFSFGIQILLFYLAAAFMGILLLECVNYIEHYGLVRKKSKQGSYERAMPHHSWNSNHVVGRLMLFELSRHSDHHYLASRKYQVLRHHDISPQMPTGYPGMMLLAHVPALWFRVMNRRIRDQKLAVQTD